MTNYTAKLPRVATLSILCGLLACDVGNKDIGADEVAEDTVGDTESSGDTESGDTEDTESSGDTDTIGGTVGTEDTDTDDATATAEDTNTSDTGQAFQGCDCIDDEMGFSGSNLPNQPTCGQSPCETIVLSGNPFDVVVENPEALDCAIAALRDRAEGDVLTWEAFAGSQQTEFGYISIVQDEQAVVRYWGLDDKSYSVSDAELGDLAPAATYEACLAEPDPALRWECMRTPLATVDFVCDEGEVF
jgi:hypothetical protein